MTETTTFGELIVDVILQITDYLSDKEKINFLSVDKKTYLLVHHVTLNQYYKLNNIINLPFYDRFESVIIENYIDDKISFPKKIKQLVMILDDDVIIKNLPKNIQTLAILGSSSIEIEIPANVVFLYMHDNVRILNEIPHICKKITFYGILRKDIIPNYIKNLELDNLDEEIKDFIPKSVKRLGLNLDPNCFWQFNCSNIPGHIEELVFGNNFNENLVSKFPSSITSIIFGENFNQPLQNHLPDNLEILSLGPAFSQSLKDLPESLIIIRLGPYLISDTWSVNTTACGSLETYIKYIMLEEKMNAKKYYIVFCKENHKEFFSEIKKTLLPGYNFDYLFDESCRK